MKLDHAKRVTQIPFALHRSLACVLIIVISVTSVPFCFLLNKLIRKIMKLHGKSHNQRRKIK